MPTERVDFIERNVIEPSGIVQVMKNHWWWCVDANPKRALFYCPRKRGVGSPQCNLVEAVAKSVGERLGHDKVATLTHIPMAFSPWED